LNLRRESLTFANCAQFQDGSPNGKVVPDMAKPSDKSPPDEKAAATPAVPPAAATAKPADGQGAARPPEIGGPAGPEPTRYVDWERNGRCVDF
jgi:hypothetical protein